MSLFEILEHLVYIFYERVSLARVTRWQILYVRARTFRPRVGRNNPKYSEFDHLIILHTHTHEEMA